MVRHCPLSFPASSYASLAPHLADYLLRSGGSGGGSSGGSTATINEEVVAPQNGLMVLLDLFAVCARGSPHFRQYVKGIPRKRELFRRLLGLLGPRCDRRIVVRALCSLTRVLAGDPLEGKVFDRANALETASLVMDSLLDLSGSTCSERTGCVGDSTLGCGDRGGGGGGTLGEQRRYADVASDLARSRVFTSVLLDTGRLASFLREAVLVLARAAADIRGHLPTDGAAATATAAEGGGRSPPRSAGRRVSKHQQRVTRPEPLLRALCSFCLEHSPARSTFIRTLLDSSSSSSSNSSDGSGTGAAATNKSLSSSSSSTAVAAEDPCAALFTLCLHPHQPSAAAASTLLQCLLVGGGALGAVSGPSPGAAAGVGVIPAGYIFTSIGGGGSGWVGAAGIGREDPQQAALLERVGAVALGTADGRQQRQPPTPAGRSRGVGGGRESGCAESSGSEGDESEGKDSNSEAWLGCGLAGGSLKRRAELTTGSAADACAGGAVRHLILRLGQIGEDLASARAQQQLGLVDPGVVSGRLAPGSAGLAGPASPRDTTAPCAAHEEGGGDLKARGVEMEQELTSLLCLLSSLALAVPVAGRAVARALPLEATLAPILAAQRSVLFGVDPVDYPRAPVEIVLVSLTLVAQLGVVLSGNGGDGCGGGGGSTVAATCDEGVAGSEEAEERGGHSSGRRRRRAATRGRQRRGRRDAARAAMLRRFLGEQAAAGEVKLCLGHAACRAESKDLARRAAALISLLQAGGGADALLVADSLYAFAQSAESREVDLRSRAVAAENAVCRERAAGARRAAALEEAEGMVAQIEARNAEDLRRFSEQESGARRRAEEAHVRALTRGEVSLRRAEENVADLERVLRSKEEALRCAGRENRARDLEIAALRGDLAGEQRVRAAIAGKLEKASSERDELSLGKAELAALLDATKTELSEVREEGLASSKGWEDERVSAARGWAAAREAEEGLGRSNARVEEAYGKLILLARGYKSLEEDSRCKAVQAERRLLEAETQNKLLLEQAREEERRHRLTKEAVKDGEAALRRAEQRLVKVSREAAEAQAAASAAKAAGRELAEKVASATREAGLRKDEASSLKAEVERSRATCAEKDLELASLSKELGQQAGIIDYINKLSSNAAAAEAAKSNNNAAGAAASTAVVQAQAVAVHRGERVTQVPDSEGHLHAL
ncbi:unnamed protein product [Pylaiella littoralis]